MSAEDQKRAVGEAAAALVRDDMTVGLGTGSTAAFLIAALGHRVVEERLRIRCVATSTTSERLAGDAGLSLVALSDVRRIHLTIDGADEIGPGLALIKGGGGALLREKLVWEASDRCLVIADQAKLVPRLGRFPLPIEIAAFGHETTARRLVARLRAGGIEAAPQLRVGADGPRLTDGGNVIYDVACETIAEPATLAALLKSLTGVVDHGLFLDLATEALVAGERGVQHLNSKTSGVMHDL